MADEAGTAANPPPEERRKRAALVALLLLLLAGLAVGLAAAFKPDAFRKSTPIGDKVVPGSEAPGPAVSGESLQPVDKAVQPVVPVTPAVVPVVPVVPAPVPPAVAPTPIVRPPIPTVPKTPGVLDPVLPPGGSTGQNANDLINKVITTDLVDNLAAGASCAPRDGPALKTALAAATCSVIVLVPGATYDMGTTETVITGRKVIVGNPVAMPLLDGKAAPRIFRVVAGGYLQLNFVRTYRGGGELIATIPVLRGGSVLVELGGSVTLTGCVFAAAPSFPPPVLVGDLRRAVRVFGGHIYVAGGTVVISLCHFYVLQPGVALREIYVVGGDVLVLAGVVVLTGCTFTNTQFFLNVGGVGAFVAQLGGESGV
jgi:hypothetical protein